MPKVVRPPSHLATLRLHAGLEQKDVAADLGVSVMKVSRWECGRNVPDIEEAKQLARLYGVDPNAVCGWNQDQSAVLGG